MEFPPGTSSMVTSSPNRSSSTENVISSTPSIEFSLFFNVIKLTQSTLNFDTNQDLHSPYHLD